MDRIYGKSGGSYNINKQIRSMLRSDLCHYNDAYIIVKETITVQAENNRAINGLIEI